MLDIRPDVHILESTCRHILESTCRPSFDCCGSRPEALLEAAKAELKHGEWKIMVKDELPFSRETAHRLIVVAQDQKLRNVAHAQHLPAHWFTLYELTKLTDEQFDAAIA